MNKLARQAGRTLGWVVHHAGMVLITLFFLFAVALGLFAYRLSLGPVQIPWITSRLASIVSGQGIQIKIEHAALAWGSYRAGGAAPLYLQLEDITARNATGAELATIPSGNLTFLPSALLGTGAPILVTSTDALFQGSNVPVSLIAAIRLGGFFSLARADLDVRLGAGALGASGIALPISSGSFDAELTPTDVNITRGDLTLMPEGASAPTLTFAGAGRFDQSWQGNVTMQLDKVRADDLAAYWPPSLVRQTRAWVTKNISVGSAQDATVTLRLSAPRNLSNIALGNATGHFHGDDLNVGWIPRAAPMTGVTGTLTLTDQNDIVITADSGTLGGLTLNGSRMTITGLTQHDQIAGLDIPVTGSVADALTLLNGAPMHLLKTAPPEIAAATGILNGMVHAEFPLRGDLKLAQANLTVTASLTNVTVPTPAPGIALTGGTLDLQATTHDLTLQGTAKLAGQTAAVRATAQFGAAPAVYFTLKSAAGAMLLKPLGLSGDPAEDDGIEGTVPFTLVVQQPATGPSTVVLEADLTPAAAGAAAFGWSKKAGAPGTVHIAAALNDQALAGFTQITASAPGLDVQAASDPANPNRLVFSALRIGATQAAGSLTAPANVRAPWVADFSGQSLDLTAILNSPAPTSKPVSAPKPSPPSGPLWQARLNFETLQLAAHGAPVLHNLVFTGSGQGGALFAAAGSADGARPIRLTVTPGAAPGLQDAIHLDTGDGGFLLRALGAYNDIDGGALDLNAGQDHGVTNGVVTLQNFRLMQAPAFTKLLEGLTIYGVPAAASGPGLGFDRLVAPFTISDNLLTLRGARAFSSSLGFTASGTINLAQGDTNLNTTIVPAYALNALPGKIPVIGKLFTAEKGGGLFSVRATITGKLTDPKVSVNPLSALTPGVLRDVFGAGGAK